MKDDKRKKPRLKELNAVIQICPNCGKIDAYKNDNHTCDREYQEYRERL